MPIETVKISLEGIKLIYEQQLRHVLPESIIILLCAINIEEIQRAISFFSSYFCFSLNSIFFSAPNEARVAPPYSFLTTPFLLKS